MTHHSKILCGIWLLVGTPAFAQGTSYLERLLPPRVQLDMSGAQLREVRKEAIQYQDRDVKNDLKNNYDLIERSGPTTIHWYYIRDGLLCGYMSTSRTTTMTVEEQKLQRNLIIPDEASGFEKVSEEEALRMGQDLRSSIISVIKWKGGALKDLTLYTVSTDREITAVIFKATSPLSGNMFFTDAKQKAKLDAQMEAVKAKLKIAEETPAYSAHSNTATASLLSSPSVNPAPLVRPTKESKIPFWFWGIVIIGLGSIGVLWYRTRPK